LTVKAVVRVALVTVPEFPSISTPAKDKADEALFIATCVVPI